MERSENNDKMPTGKKQQGGPEVNPDRDSIEGRRDEKRGENVLKESSKENIQASESLDQVSSLFLYCAIDN